MAKKIKLTRPEMKRQRDMLHRFERYLPMLKLKQQQLQVTIRKVASDRAKVQADLHAAREKFSPYERVLSDRAGVDVLGLARPEQIRTSTTNIAGVNVPVFEDLSFPQASYSLFATPAWVDRALADLREISRCEEQLRVIDRQYELLRRELTKITQRVNLFEKVKIPESREAIRVIRIRLGDEMTAAVGRAKIAKSKIQSTESHNGAERQDMPSVENNVEEATAG